MSATPHSTEPRWCALCILYEVVAFGRGWCVFIHAPSFKMILNTGCASSHFGTYALSTSIPRPTTKCIRRYVCAIGRWVVSGHVNLEPTSASRDSISFRHLHGERAHVFDVHHTVAQTTPRHWITYQYVCVFVCLRVCWVNDHYISVTVSTRASLATTGFADYVRKAIIQY